MKILIITHLFWPDRGGGASVFSDLCFGLVERGHEVDVLAGYPYYPEWRNKSSANLWRIARETIRGVRLHRHGFYIPSTPGSLVQRLIYELSFTLSLLRSIRRSSKSDLTIVYCPLMGSLLFAVLRKWLLNERLWLNVQDIPADAAAASGISRSKGFNKMAEAVQRFLFRTPDVVSTISPVMNQRVDEIVGHPGRSTYFPNWLNRSMEEAIERLAEPRSSTRTEVPVILYAGNVGKKQGLLNYCQRLAATNLKFEFRIFGAGGESDALLSWVKNSGDQRFSMAGFLPEADFVRELYRADYFVITETADVGASFIPSKMIPCIATGTPILAVCEANGPLGQEVLAHGLGVVLDWNGATNLQPFLTDALLNSETYKGMVSACLIRSQVYRRSAALDLVEAEVARCETDAASMSAI